MIEVQIKGEYIQLNQFLKKENIVMSGGEAKMLIASGTVFVNDTEAFEIRKKLRDGDRVRIENVGEYLIKAED
ncbi:MAG: RNA-binding S4 domain-containing protein [Firmicutes bacterium]|nr:RNA-binding S4 domain-containing protein [Bacillota bacterium]